MQTFVNFSGMQFNTVHANDFHFYEELNAVVQHEPADAFDPETVGLFAAIGIKKGKPFAPDARMKAILTDAVAVGNATARAILVRVARPARENSFPTASGAPASSAAATSSWKRRTHARCAHAVSLLRHGHHAGDGRAKPGTGSAYEFAARDSQGRYFDGGKTYKITLPGPSLSPVLVVHGL